METCETVIVGGGISGVYAASLLAGKGRPFILLEARERLGGRILSADYHGFFSDLGPSWYWPEINPRMVSLIRTLGLRGYRQYEFGKGRFQHPDGHVQSVRGYAMAPSAWRVSGGMIALIENLVQNIPERAIRFNHPVSEIENVPDGVLIHVGEPEKKVRFRIKAGQVILALPPRLAAASILFTPDLDQGVTQAMLKLGTWMAGQAKFCAIYPEPYWRETGLSGLAFSQRGPLGEIHDGSNDGGGPYGLTGFVCTPAAQRSPERAVIEAILDQLGMIYGKSATEPVAVYYQDWAREPHTATPFDQRAMREHPVYQPPAGQTSLWEGRIRFAGTETASEYGGYLEGALFSAERAVMGSANPSG